MSLTAPIWQLQEVQVSVDCFCWSGKCLLNIYFYALLLTIDCVGTFPHWIWRGPFLLFLNI